MVGFNQINGIEITDWQDGSGAVQLRITENHLNPAYVVHGGVLLAMLDVAQAMLGSYFALPSPLMPERTLHLSTQFLSGAKRAYDILYATSKRTGGGTSVFLA